MSKQAMKSGRQRGRPAKSSREEILSFATDMLRRDQGAEFSLSGLARAMGMTPMAMYSYFDDKNDLQQALAERLLANIPCDLSACDTWQEKICLWANSLRSYLLENPYVISHMGWRGHIAGGWLRYLALLTRVLEEAGVNREELPLTVRWFSTAVFGLISSEIAFNQDGIALQNEDLPKQDPLSTEIMRPLLKEFITADKKSVFSHQLKSSIHWLEHTVIYKD